MGCAASTGHTRQQALSPVAASARSFVTQTPVQKRSKALKGDKLLAELRVLRATGLPKVERQGSINPYIIVSGEGVRFQTKTKLEEQDPVFDESFLFPCISTADGGISLSIKLEVYHETPAGSTRIAYAHFQAEGYPPKQLPHLSLALAFDDLEHAVSSPNASIEVGILGWIYGYATLCKQLAGVPGVVVNDALCRVYIPMIPGVYLGVEYHPDRVEFKACTSRKAAPVFIDMGLEGQDGELLRQVWQEGHEVASGFKIFEEVKVEGLGLAFDSSRLLITTWERVSNSALDLDSILIAHDWRAGEEFAEAAATLTDSMVDFDDLTIFVPVEYGPEPETAVFTKWTAEGPGPLKVAVMKPAEGSEEQGILLGVVGQDFTAHCSLHARPLPLAAGKLPAVRVWSIVSTSSDMAFSDIFIYKYRLCYKQQFCLLQFLQLRPDKYPWPPANPAALLRTLSADNLEMAELTPSTVAAFEKDGALTQPMAAWALTDNMPSSRPPVPPASLSSVGSVPQPFLGPPHSSESYPVSLSTSPPQVTPVPNPFLEPPPAFVAAPPLYPELPKVTLEQPLFIPPVEESQISPAVPHLHRPLAPLQWQWRRPQLSPPPAQLQAAPPGPSLLLGRAPPAPPSPSGKPSQSTALLQPSSWQEGSSMHAVHLPRLASAVRLPDGGTSSPPVGGSMPQGSEPSTAGEAKEGATSQGSNSQVYPHPAYYSTRQESTDSHPLPPPLQLMVVRMESYEPQEAPAITTSSHHIW